MVNGQKVWTSGAHDADYCFCFVRTDPDAPKHAGISVLVIDMRTPGIETRPLAELTDRHHADFNEVFFTDVEVGDRTLSANCTTVGRSRADHWHTSAGCSGSTRRPGSSTSSNRWWRQRPRRWTTGGGWPTTRCFANRSPVRTSSLRPLKLLGYQGFSKIAKGRLGSGAFGAQASRLSELRRGLALEISEALGPPGVDLDSATMLPQSAGATTRPGLLHHLQSFAGTIAGGTSEIQRNIIAERVRPPPPVISPHSHGATIGARHRAARKTAERKTRVRRRHAELRPRDPGTAATGSRAAVLGPRGPDDGPRAARRDLQNERLRDLVRKIFDTPVPLFKRKLDDGGVTWAARGLETVDDLRHVPLTVKQDLRDSEAEHPPWGDYRFTDPRAARCASARRRGRRDVPRSRCGPGATCGSSTSPRRTGAGGATGHRPGMIVTHAHPAYLYGGRPHAVGLLRVLRAARTSGCPRPTPTSSPSRVCASGRG